MLFRSNRYTLICTHTSLAAFFTRRACAGWHDRPPLVNVAHGYLFGPDTPFWKKSILLAAEKMTAPQTDLLLTMNRWDCETACRCRLGKTVEQIPGVGVEFSRFDAPPAVSRPALRRRLGLEQEDFVLIYPAEFSARKNQAMLLRALARLPDSVKLLLPGQGAQLDACRSLSAALRLESRVIFPGQISDMSSWYHAADAAVSVSRSEGLPFNVMEAMYCRLPVAASAVKGHTDLLCDGVSGLLFPADSIDLLVQKLSALQTSPELRRGLTDSAFDAVQPYSLERVLPPVMEKYLSVLPRAARIGAEVR